VYFLFLYDQLCSSSEVWLFEGDGSDANWGRAAYVEKVCRTAVNRSLSVCLSVCMGRRDDPGMACTWNKKHVILDAI
jgi:hypothetical protein